MTTRKDGQKEDASRHAIPRSRHVANKYTYLIWHSKQIAQDPIKNNATSTINEKPKLNATAAAIDY